MSDYKRLISYIYNYEGRVKQNNVGFAKIELRESQCKVSVNIKATTLNGQKLRVYFFYRENNKMIQILLSESTVSRGVLEWKGITSAKNIMNTGHTFDQMAGMLFYYSIDKYYATEWDDQEVYLEKLCEYGKIQQQETKIEPKFVTVPREEITYVNEKKAAQEAVVKSQEDIVKSILDSIDSGIEIFMNMQKKEEELKIAQITDQVEEQEKDFDDGIVDDITDDTAKLVGYRFLKWYRGKETCQRQEDVDKEEEDNREEKIESQNETLEAANTEKVLEQLCATDSLQVADEVPVEDIAREKDMEQETFDYEKEEDFDKWEKHIAEENKRKISTAERILKKYPALKPFDDNEIVSCVRIEPGDIGLFPIENWVLGNNSFLLHGYYNFRHLIFAKKESGDEIEYLLGVPGIYQNREKFMAKMFGFTQFKPAKNVTKFSGEFGYWYIKINM